MADTFTENLNLTLPEIGASDDTWGDKLNDNLDIQDAFFGTTGEGTVIVRDNSDRALVSGINLTKAAGNARLLEIKSGTSSRWDFGADATAEAGSDSGSLFKINRYSDAGSLLGTPLQIDRASGLITFASTPKVGANDVLHQGNLSNIATLVGAPVPWLTNTLPTGYLWMNGQLVSRTTYALLFALLGTTFGVGDSATTFGLPDWREVVPVGKSTMGGIAARGLVTHLTLTDTAAAPVGEAKHTLLAAEHAAHDHDVFLNDPGHGHTVSGLVGSNPVSTGTGSGTGVQNPGGTSAAPNTTGITVRSAASGGGIQNKTAAQGSATPFNVVQPSVVCNWIIKALA